MKSGRIYIHIPFCQKACTYCNFHFTTRTDLINAYVQALVSEIHQRSHTLAAEIQSVYFGGGTPSLLNPDQLNVILKTLTGYAKLTPDAEITLEINPEDTNQERVVQWLDLGINRFSVGVQSLDEAELAWMGRIHTINKTYKLLELFYKNNVKNYNLDLIFGSKVLLGCLDKIQIFLLSIPDRYTGLLTMAQTRAKLRSMFRRARHKNFILNLYLLQ